MVYGWGDLNTAFKRLGRDGVNRNQWRDGYTLEFKGATPKGVIIGAKKSFWKGNIVAPAAAVEFMSVMDKHIQEFSSLTQAHIKQSQIVINAANDPARNWELLNRSLSFIDSNAEKASQFLWLAPTIISTNSKGAAFSRKAAPYIQRGDSFLGVASKISGYATRILNADNEFVKYKRTGMSTEDAVGMVALKSALGCLPILGNFYAEALDLIPGMKKWFQQIVKGYTDRIDSIPGLWVQKPIAFLPPGRQNSPSCNLSTGWGRSIGRQPGPEGLA